MKTVKLMVVNAARERERHLIGCVFDAVEVHEPLGTVHVIQGGYLNEFIVNPLDTDEDLTIRVGGEPENALSTCGKYRRRRSASCWFAH
nr:unknown function [Klebsiella phage vB_Kpn_K17alpha61]